MKRNKPVKIKRYRRSFSGAGDRNNLLRRILLWVLILAAIFGVGWLIAKPGLDLASSLWYSYKNRGEISSSAPAEPSSSQPQQTPTPSATPAPETADTLSGDWAQVSLSSVDTAEKAAALADQLAQQGVQYAVLTLKDDRGYLYYNSQVPLASGSISSAVVDAASVAQAFRDAGVTPVAGLCAFKDSLAPYADRSAAVKYGSEDITWLDSSAELGGKPWLNPNAASAQQYIADLIAEVRDLGFETVLIQNLQFPEGNGLDLAGYGEMTLSQPELLAELGHRYEEIEGVEVWFEFPAAAISGQSLTGYGASPATFGLQRVVVRLESTSTTNEAGEAVTVAPATDAASLAALSDPLTAGGTSAVALRLVGLAGDQLTALSQTVQQAGFSGLFTAP